MFELLLILSLNCVFNVPALSSGGPIGPTYSGGGYTAIQAAIQSTRSFKLVAVPLNKEPAQLTIIEIDPVESPVSVQFLSASSPVAAKQVHIPGEPGLLKGTASQEEPHRLQHTITKPIIQEVREIIFPYRFLQQQLLPVQEQVNAVTAKGTPRIKSVEPAQPILIIAPPMIETPAPQSAALESPVQSVALIPPTPLAAPALLEAPVPAVPETLTVPETTLSAPETIKVLETLAGPISLSVPKTQILRVITPTLAPLVSNRKASFKSWGY